MIRTALFLALALIVPHAAFAQGAPARYPITGEDGSPVLNRRILPEKAAEAEKLPGAVVVANPDGDVTLIEFYDLNCPHCRRASADVDALLKADSKLRLVLVPLPVLGIPSVLAGRVEIALSKAVTPSEFYRFHRAIYAGRGVIDGQRAMNVASDFKVDMQKLVDAANDDSITEIMKAHLRFINGLGLNAVTPSFLIQDVIIQGHPGRKSLKAAIDSVRKCGKAVC